MKFDEIGLWSEIKLEILEKYLVEYTKILSSNKKKKKINSFFYIDAFAGAGTHLKKQTGEEIKGSPRIALDTNPPFDHYFFIDWDKEKIEYLSKVAGNREDVTIRNGDCNVILLDKVFDKVKWEDRNRALCLLDPYGLHLNWEVIKRAGEMGTIEIFLNFPLMDMNMNIFLTNPNKIQKSQMPRIQAFWGDDSWKECVYSPKPDLFDDSLFQKKEAILIAKAFKERLKKVAGFKYVPDPIPMRNSNKGIVYYLFFASPNPTGNKIVKAIFDKYKRKGWI